MKALILVLMLWMPALAAPAFARSVFIGIDVSKSNPVVIDEASAKVAGNYVRGIVAALAPGDEVHIRTFGDRSAAHVESRSIRLGRKHKPETVAFQIGSYIASLPSKPLQGQQETQILAYLELSQFRCDQNSLVVIVSDALESSPGVRQKDLLAGKPLPPPEPGILKGCEVVIYGLARSKDGAITREQAKSLRASWTAWMNTAGANFTAITE
ncbi:MAG TPA: hypothetical protein VGE08_03965 [Steroidobacter sp.]|uniref:hypothetical protein n=1 Tax=Steroidobacter sp. TaxID=1978227 RepID=UPI002ED86874